MQLDGIAFYTMKATFVPRKSTFRCAIGTTPERVASDPDGSGRILSIGSVPAAIGVVPELSVSALQRINRNLCDHSHSKEGLQKDQAENQDEFSAPEEKWELVYDA